MSARRFPPPWTVEELDACFVVRDQNGQQLAYVYLENEPGRRSAGKLLSKDGRKRLRRQAARVAQVVFRSKLLFLSFILDIDVNSRGTNVRMMFVPRWSAPESRVRNLAAESFKK